MAPEEESALEQISSLSFEKDSNELSKSIVETSESLLDNIVSTPEILSGNVSETKGVRGKEMPYQRSSSQAKGHELGEEGIKLLMQWLMLI